jgi:hypothetical protein
MYTVSEVGSVEDKYGERVCERLGHILEATIDEQRNPDKTKPDGVIMVDRTEIPCMFIELKQDFGEGTCDATSPASLSMRWSMVCYYNWNHLDREKCVESQPRSCTRVHN